jgi:multiple sugar transport system ATP-binding protein
MTVYENMAFGLKQRKTPKAEIDKRVQESAELLGIKDYLLRRPKELSGGQRQRVALGRAIVREPQVFLMDEPLSNLDAKLRVQTRAELTKLHRRLGITTIYVTHDQVEAMTMGDRIAVMKDGVLQQCDTPMEIYTHPANLFVAGFIGTPSMNFVPATLRKQAAGYVVDAAAFKIDAPVAHNDKLAEWAEKKVVLGIRPGDIFDKSLKNPVESIPGNTFFVDVDVVEPMGDVSTFYVKAGESDLIATIDGESKGKIGDKIEFVVDISKIHLFDAESEKAIF